MCVENFHLAGKPVMNLERAVLFVVLERWNIFKLIDKFRYLQISYIVIIIIIIIVVIIVVTISNINNLFADPPGNGTTEHCTAISPGGRQCHWNDNQSDDIFILRFGNCTEKFCSFTSENLDSVLVNQNKKYLCNRVDLDIYIMTMTMMMMTMMMMMIMMMMIKRWIYGWCSNVFARRVRTWEKTG